VKDTLTKRFNIILALIILQAVFGIFYYAFIQRNNEIIVLVQLFLLVISIVLLIVLVYKPFYRLKKALKLFTEEQRGFHLAPDVCAEWDKFEQSVNALVDRKFEINAASKNAEFLALQNQINPHFLYNTLEAIRADALRAKIDTIAKTTEALADFFRYTITEVDKVLSLEDELNNVENYFIIQHYRFGDKLKMRVFIRNDDLSVSKVKLPKLTLQPIVENAIYHGLEKRVEGGTITIKVEATASKLLINIVDDGVGIEPEKLNQLNERLSSIDMYLDEDDGQYRGIALRNVNSRIKLLFGADYGIHVFSTKGIGTDVRLTLPLLHKD